MTKTLRCKTEHDQTIIKLILEGNDFTVTVRERGDLFLDFEDNAHIREEERISGLPSLNLEEATDNILFIFTRNTHLDVTEIEEYLGEIERLRDILEEIAVRVGEEYVTHSYRRYRR